MREGKFSRPEYFGVSGYLLWPVSINFVRKFGYTCVLDLVYSEHICPLTVFVHRLAEDLNHILNLIVRIFICIYEFITL